MRLHDSRPMCWGTIPDQNESPTDMVVYMLERLYNQIAIYRSSKVPLINLSLYTQPNSGRKFTSRALTPQDRWFATWRPGMCHSLLKRPTDLIIKDDAGA